MRIRCPTPNSGAMTAPGIASRQGGKGLGVLGLKGLGFQGFRVLGFLGSGVSGFEGLAFRVLGFPV